MAALNVYFSNIRGYHQGFPELSASSLSLCPDIVVLVETHLAGEPLQMKLPRGYVVAAHRDRSRHGGGVLLLCRDDLLVDSVDCGEYYVSATSEIIGVRYQETIILCIYRQPSPTDITLIDSLTRFRIANRHCSIIVVGDFNVHDRDWLGSPFTSPAGAALCGFCEMFGLSQLVEQGTRRDAILDLAISEHAGTVSYHPHLGTSDHIAIFVRFHMSLHMPSSLPTRTVYHWKSAPWNHVRGYFRRVQWNFLKSESIPDAIDTFVNILTKARDRYVPSTMPTVRRPTVWWDRNCQRTYQRKLRAWHSHDWPSYRTFVLAAKRAQAIAFRAYRRSLRAKLQSEPPDRLWWNLTKNISGLSQAHNRSAPDVDSLASFFAQKLSLSSTFDPGLSTIPPESDVTYKKTWRVKLSRVRSGMSSLVVTKAVGPDGVSPYILLC